MSSCLFHSSLRRAFSRSATCVSTTRTSGHRPPQPANAPALSQPIEERPQRLVNEKVYEIESVLAWQMWASMYCGHRRRWKVEVHGCARPACLYVFRPQASTHEDGGIFTVEQPVPRGSMNLTRRASSSVKSKLGRSDGDGKRRSTKSGLGPTDAAVGFTKTELVVQR